MRRLVIYSTMMLLGFTGLATAAQTRNTNKNANANANVNRNVNKNTARSQSVSKATGGSVSIDFGDSPTVYAADPPQCAIGTPWCPSPGIPEAVWPVQSIPGSTPEERTISAWVAGVKYILED
jgi:hypothetical protein